MSTSAARERDYESIIAGRMRMRGARVRGALATGPARLGVDPLDNLHCAYGVALLLTAWSGSLVRLRRGSDNAEADFSADAGTGYLDAAAISAWLAGATAYVPRLYNQAGGTDATQGSTGQQPTLDLSGAFPVLSFTASQRLLLPNAFAQDVAAASVVAVRRHTAPAASNEPVVSFQSGSTIGYRIGLGYSAADGFRLVGRRLDAETNSILGVGTSNTDWGVQIGRIDYATGAGFLDVEGSAPVTNPAFCATTGLTSNTPSQTGSIGLYGSGALVGQVSAMLATRDKLSEIETDGLIAKLAPLKL